MLATEISKANLKFKKIPINLKKILLSNYNRNLYIYKIAVLSLFYAKALQNSSSKTMSKLRSFLQSQTDGSC